MLSDKLKKPSGRISSLFIEQSGDQPRIPDFANMPATRRKFMAGMLAGAGSLALSACGGGGGGSSGTAVANRSAVANAQSTESAQQTVMPPATSIIDSGGNTWTLVNGAVLQGGVNTYCPVSAVYVMYWNHTIYCENQNAWWYVYGSNGWTACPDPRGSSESAQQTVMPPAASIVDASGNSWTLSNGAVLRGGVNTGCPVAAVYVMYWNHTVYCENEYASWYVYGSSGWAATTDPRIGAESAQETVVPPATSIVDASGNAWTLSNGIVYRGGVNTNCPVAAVYLMYWNHTVYCENENASWYVYGSSGWTATTDPRAAAAQVAASNYPLFYGMNGHLAWPTGVYSNMTAAQQLAILQDLGVTNYRADVAGSGMAQTVANALAGAFKNSGVSILPCINPTAYDQTASESTAYALGYNLAVSIMTPLKGLVSYVECGNELEANGLISNGAGNSPSNYNPAYWPAYRGVLRGMIDGVKSVDPTVKCGINVGVALAYGALQMLWNGQTPNGTATPTSGATPLKWDITMYHWYESSGDITRAGPQGLTNVLQILQQSFNLPIWLTEWGFQLSDSSSGQCSYVTNTLAEYYSLRETYNLQSVMMYELIDMASTDTYGLIEADGATHKPCYASFKSYTAANRP
jgi:hypothetical protein